MAEIRRLLYSSPQITEALNHILRQPSVDRVELTEGALEHIVRIDPQVQQVYVLVEDGYIVGTGTLVINHLISGAECWIKDVLIDHDFKVEGLTQKILEHLISVAPPYVDSINMASKDARQIDHHLYQQLGFAKRNDFSLMKPIK